MSLARITSTKLPKDCRYKIFICTDLIQKKDLFYFYSYLLPKRNEDIYANFTLKYIINKKKPELEDKQIVYRFYKRDELYHLKSIWFEDIETIYIDRELYLKSIDGKDPELRECMERSKIKANNNELIKTFVFNSRKKLISIF